MAAISAAEVKSLREKTGLPMMDCKQALSECNGDPEAADSLASRARRASTQQAVGP